jgi:hypothetical protein
MPLSDCVTLEEVKAHLRVTIEDEDADIESKRLAAAQIVTDHLHRRDADWNAEVDAWTVDTVPLSIKQAVLVQCGDLYWQRGDDPQQAQKQMDRGYLSPAVQALCKRYRDPALA